MSLSNILKGWSKTKRPSLFNPTNENEAGSQFFGFITPQFLLMNQTWTRDQTRPDKTRHWKNQCFEHIGQHCAFLWFLLNGGWRPEWYLCVKIWIIIEWHYMMIENSFSGYLTTKDFPWDVTWTLPWKQQKKPFSEAMWDGYDIRRDPCRRWQTLAPNQ